MPAVLRIPSPSASSWHAKMRIAPAAERTSADGIVFHSRGEMRRWAELQLLERGRVITDLKRQVRFALKRPDSDIAAVTTATGKVATFTLDFLYRDVASGLLVYEDWKGYRTRESQLRIALFENLYGVKVVLSGPNRSGARRRRPP
jgi:hypothetical protein